MQYTFETMMNKAKQTILMTDHTKFNSSHFLKIGDFADYDVLITDCRPEDEYLPLFEDKEIELVYPY